MPSRRGSALGSLDPPPEPKPWAGLDLNDPAVHKVTIFSDSDAYALSGGTKRVPMSALSKWCTVPPERTNEIIILTDPNVTSSVSVNFIGVDIQVFGAMVEGYDTYAFWTANAVVYNRAFGYEKPACDIDMGMVYPFGDKTANTLTIEPKDGMRIAIFNVTSTTADAEAQTIPRKPLLAAASPSPSSSVTVPLDTSTTAVSSTTNPVSTDEINASGAGNGKESGPPLEAIVAPAVILGMCLIAGLILLYFCVFKRRKLRGEKLYGPIDWAGAPAPPMREANPARINLPPSLVGSDYSGSSERPSPAHSTDPLVQPYLLIQDSRAPDPPPKAALVGLTNKRPVRAYPFQGFEASSSRNNAHKASLLMWKTGLSDTTTPPSSSGSSTVEPESTRRASERDPRTLVALEQAVRHAGFSTQALLESLHRVGEARGRASVGTGEEGLPRYRA